jgi:hypothetical protein
MILTVTYRGVFRQEQYETAAVEGSITADTAADWPGLTTGQVMAEMHRQLRRLILPAVRQAARASRYGEHETTIYEWERMISDGTGDQAPRRVQAPVSAAPGRQR